MGFFNCSKVDYNVATNEGTSYDYLTYGAGCVEVEVDCHTGDIKVSSAHLVLDVGRSLNPAIDIGQVKRFDKSDLHSLLFYPHFNKSQLLTD